MIGVLCGMCDMSYVMCWKNVQGKKKRKTTKKIRHRVKNNNAKGLSKRSRGRKTRKHTVVDNVDPAAQARPSEKSESDRSCRYRVNCPNGQSRVFSEIIVVI